MFETLFAVTMVLSTLVPGYIYQKVRSKFFVHHREHQVELAMMNYAISGMAILSLMWPVTTLLGIDPVGLMISAEDGKGIVKAIQSAPISWIFQLFVVPALLAVANVYLTRIPIITKLPALLKLKPLEKEPDAVSEMVAFMKKHRPYVKVLLKSDATVHGKMSVGSAISVEEPFPDMFLASAFTVEPGTDTWTRMASTTAIFIRGSDVKAVFLYSEVALTPEETVHEQDK